ADPNLDRSNHGAGNSSDEHDAVAGLNLSRPSDGIRSGTTCSVERACITGCHNGSENPSPEHNRQASTKRKTISPADNAVSGPPPNPSILDSPWGVFSYTASHSGGQRRAPRRRCRREFTFSPSGSALSVFNASRLWQPCFGMRSRVRKLP